MSTFMISTGISRRTRLVPALLTACMVALGAGLAPDAAEAQDRGKWTNPDFAPPPGARYDRTPPEYLRDREEDDPPRYAPAPPPSYAPAPRYGDGHVPPRPLPIPGGYGDPYAPPPAYGEPYRAPGYGPPPAHAGYDGDYRDGTYAPGEIRDAGHRFFGSISAGLASVIEYAFQRQGRPNGYILGEDLGGAFVGGLRYGEGWLHTKERGRHKVFWQGPSLGFDAGVEGSKVMVLVYNLRDPSEIYQRFGGVAGSAYVVGGVGLTFQANDHLALAPIRAGLGFRFGASVGYLKYTRRPTWNPF